MGVYDRQIASAQRQIAKKGAIVQWCKASEAAPGGDEFRPQKDEDAEPVTFDVAIAFFPPSELGRGSAQFEQAIAKSDVPTGYEIGLMAGGTEFTPELTDTILRDGKTVPIIALDRIAPNGEAVLWYVAVCL